MKNVFSKNYEVIIFHSALFHIMAKKLSRWTMLKKMSLLMKPTSPVEGTVIAFAVICIFLGKWLDVASIKKRGLIISSLRSNLNGLDNPSLPNTHILTFFLLRTLSSVFIEAKAVLFSVVTNRAVQNISSQVLYLAICTAHIHEIKATEMNRIIERGGKQITKVLGKVFAEALPNMLRLVLVFWEVYSIFGARYFIPLLAITLTYVAYTFTMFRVRAAYKHKINTTDNSVSRRVQESISNVDLVKTCCNEYIEVGNLLDEMRKMWILRVKDAGCVGFTNFGQRALYTILFAHIAFMGVMDVSTGRCTIGNLSILFSFILSIDTSMRTLGTMAKDMGFSLVDSTELLCLNDYLKRMAANNQGLDVSRIDEDLEEMGHRYKRIDLQGPHQSLMHLPSPSHNPKIQDISQTQNIEEEAAIEFENVNFMYSSTPVLENISFKVRRGERVAIVGESGCGKSTILKLALMFYNYTGNIKINGREIREIPVTDLRSSIGYILQDMSLFDETIFYNVLYGMPDARPNEVLEACRKAGLCEVIRKRGLYSKVGNGGILLSGGEVQMVALARCLLKSMDIMLLDEVTAKLDTNLEREVFNLIMRIKNKTIVMVLHSLWMTEHMDRIIFIENGIVKEVGSHSELMTQKGKYWEMKTIAMGLKPN